MRGGRRTRCYCVYIMASRSRTLYTGVTNHLGRRVYEHKRKLIKGFTCRYNITRLVYYETATNIWDAISAEKRIRGWSRAKKVALIESMNPRWEDLSEGWYAEEPVPPATRGAPSPPLLSPRVGETHGGRRVSLLPRRDSSLRSE